MKRYRPHRVPLSTGALAVLDEARGLHGDGEIAFRGATGGKLSPTAVADALRKAEINATGHGFRSSFKDWPRHEGVDGILSEFALAHVEGSKTVAAYVRDDLLEKRRPVMEAWSDVVAGQSRKHVELLREQSRPVDRVQCRLMRGRLGGSGDREAVSASG